MTTPEHLREPPSFALARIFTVILLGLCLGGLAAFNIVRFTSSPIILRDTIVSEPIYFPSLLISTNDYARGDQFNVVCSRSTRDVNAANGLNSVDVATVRNVTRGKDYDVNFFVDPPYQKAVPFLFDARKAMPKPLVPFSAATAGSASFDVLFSCQVNVTNAAVQTMYILGDVAIQSYVNINTDASPNFKEIPRFPSTENVFLTITQQFFNVVLRVTKYCTLQQACQYRYKIEFSQTSQLPAVAPPAGVGTLGRGIFSIQIANDPGEKPSTYQMTLYEEYRSYGYLEILSSVLSFFSLLLLIYAFLMGGRRVAPFGFMQLVLLRNQARDYIHQVEEGAGNEVQGLRDLLFKFYLRGHFVPMVPPGKMAYRDSATTYVSPEKAEKIEKNAANLQRRPTIVWPPMMPMISPPLQPGSGNGQDAANASVALPPPVHTDEHAGRDARGGERDGWGTADASHVAVVSSGHPPPYPPPSSQPQ